MAATPNISERTSFEITQEDLAPILKAHQGNQEFRKALQAATTCHYLLQLFGRYVEFNSIFGAGVSNLAAEFAIRHDLFRDGSEKISFLSDRSVEIAAYIYHASVDEFGGAHFGNVHFGGAQTGFTHRALAQATLKGFGEFFGYTDSEMNDALTLTPQLEEAIRAVEKGYLLIRGELTDRDLFMGIGFHMGSEILADEEFNILEQFLSQEYSALMRFLKMTKVDIGGVAHPSSYWIAIHTTVEQDHFAFALKGANLALKYYQGPSKEDMRQAVLEGFVHFSEVQAGFMNSLGANIGK